MRGTFTPEQIRILSANENVSRCGATTVRYTKAFRKEAMRLYNEEGLSAVEIFRNAGIDPAIIGKYSPNRLMHQWRYALRENPDNPKPVKRPNKDLKMLRAQVAYLKAENHFLAQLRAKKQK